MSSASSTPPPPDKAPVAADAPAAAAPAAPPPPHHWRERIRNLSPLAKGVIVAALVLIAVAWYILSGRVTTDDAQVDCHITAVAPQVPGYVVQLLINDNTPVKEGDLLVQIDPREYQAEVEQAKANLDFAEAQANSAQTTDRFDACNYHQRHQRRRPRRKNPMPPITRCLRRSSSNPPPRTCKLPKPT